MAETRAGEGTDWASFLSRPVIFAPFLIALVGGLSYFYADRSLPNPDEGAGLSAAVKILRGLVFYRSIDAYPFPGSSYLLALAMSIFGEHLSVARGLAGSIYCISVLGLYASALRLLDRRRAALFGLCLLSMKFLAAPNFTAYVYSDLAFACAVIAVALFLRHDYRGFSWRMVAVGLCVGGALGSKQNTGIYLGAALLVLLLFPPPGSPLRKGGARDLTGEIGALALGVGVAVLPMLLYFAWQGLLTPLLYSGLVRPFTGYLPTSGISFAEVLKWWELGSLRGLKLQPYLPLYYVEMLRNGLLPFDHGGRGYWFAGELFARLLYTSVVVAFAVAGLRWLRALRRPATVDPGRSGVDARTAAFFAFALLALAVTASAFPRADYPHVINVYPMVLLLLFALVGPVTGRRLALEASVVAALLLSTAFLAHRFDQSLTERLTMERAAVWANPRESWVESMVAYVEEEVAPDEPLFVNGHEAHFYFLTGRYFPWPFLQLYPGMAGGDQGRALAQMLARARPPVVLQGVTEWPGTPHLQDYTQALQSVIRRFYAVDEHAFELYPPAGGEPPLDWVLTVRRRRDLPPAAVPTP